jgi:hypothetical protein
MNINKLTYKSPAPKIYWELEDELKISVKSTPDYEKLVSFKKNEKMPIHRWYNFKEGYAATLVDSMLREFDAKPNSYVLDPFAGSGTTLLSAQWKGLRAVGIDIDPFFTFVQQVKLSWFELDLKEVRTELEKMYSVDEQKASTLNPPELSSFAGKKRPVFETQTLKELLVFKEAIANIGNEKVRRLFKLAIASILEEVSLAKKDGKSLKFSKNKKTKSVKSAITKKLEDMYSDLLQVSQNRLLKKTDVQAFTADTRKKDEVQKCLGCQKVNFVMFSPPYLNTFDYTEVYKLELWFLDFIKTYAEFKALRARTLRSHNLWKWESTKVWENKSLEQMIEGVEQQDLWTKALPVMIQGYFDDMFQSLKNLNDVMEENSYCIIVVGNSCYGNIPIPTDLLLSKAAIDTNFELKEIRVARQLNTSSQQLQQLKDETLRKYLRESIIILKKGRAV